MPETETDARRARLESEVRRAAMEEFQMHLFSSEPPPRPENFANRVVERLGRSDTWRHLATPETPPG